MLSDKAAIAAVAVKNLESAKTFYEGTLGLTKVMENEEALAFKTGASTLFIYRSQRGDRRGIPEGPDSIDQSQNATAATRHRAEKSFRASCRRALRCA
jgi:catechol 2,3-dioxygenase-like lactoylglutathione lyase family enzyme